MAGAAIVGGLLILGSIAAAIAGGGDDTPTPTPDPTRPAYTTPIPIPGEGIAWDDVDAAMCLAFASVGAANAQALLDDVLARVWPQVPWPRRPGDHTSVTRVQMLVGGRVSAFVNRVESGQLVCQAEPPEGPPPPPPPPAGPPSIDPYVTGHAGGFKYVVAGSNPSLWSQQAGGFAAAETSKIRALLECAAGSAFNLLFVGRKWNVDNYGRHSFGGKFYDINFGWLKRHMNVPALYAMDGATRLARNVGWDSGNLVNADFQNYFTPWIPQALFVGGIVTCKGVDIFAPERNPPPEVLAKLGWPGGIAELKASFLNSPLAP